MSSPATFLLEYAKSGRAACRGCKNNISQESLRIGKQVPATGWDGVMTMWYHPRCLKDRVPSIELAGGFDDLRPDDQTSLKKQFGSLNQVAVAAAAAAVSASSSSSVNSTAVLLALASSSTAGKDQFKCEYAKSSRSKCVECSDTIGEGEVRIGKMEKSDKFDGIIPRWHHLACVFKRCIILSHVQLDNFDDLRPEDQKEVKSLIAKHSPVAAGNGTTASDDSMAVEDTKKATKSGRSKKGQKRGRNDEEDEDEAQDEEDSGKKKKGKKGKKAEKEDTDEKEEIDYSKMTVAQLKEVCKEKGLEVSGKKADLVSRLTDAMAVESTSSSSSSAPKSEGEIFEAQILAESRAMWTMIDSFKDELTTAHMKAFLEANDVYSVGGPADLQKRVADILMYGVISRCPSCNHRSLVFQDGKYVCKGHVNEWSSCIFTVDDIAREEPEFPDYPDFWSTFKFRMQKKPIKAYQHKAQQAALLHQAQKAAQDAVAAKVQEKAMELEAASKKNHLFDGLIFAIAGRLSVSQTAFQEMLEDHGGKLTDDMSEANVLVVGKADVVQKGGAKIEKAKEANVPIVKQEFVTESIEALELKDPANYKLIDGDLNKLKSAVEESKKKSAAKSVIAGTSSSSSSSSSKSGKSGVVKKKVKGRCAVEDSNLEDSCHVLDVDNVVWNASLSATDLTRNTNSYYTLQLLETDKGGKYYVYRAWGRTGESIGGTKTEDFGSALASAKKNFTELFYEKSGNRWDQKANFQKKPGKLNLVDVVYGGEDSLSSKSEIVPGTRSKLDRRVQSFVQLIFDVKAIQAALLEMEIDLDKMPLGQLSKKHLEKGYSVLKNLAELIKNKTNDLQQFTSLSSQFYTIVPQMFRGKPPLINDEKILSEKLELVNTLLQVEITTSLLKESADQVGEDPVDAHYKKLKTDMVPIEKDTNEWTLVNNYLQRTHASTHRTYALELVSLFKISREGEYDRYKEFEKDKNRMLLWHGSRTSNFAGILSQGLRIAPPEAPVTGYMFGKGVYFADSSSKSANYCFTNASAPTGIMLLSEVALGEQYKLTHSEYIEKLKPQFLSTKGCGRSEPDPKEFVTLDNGCVVPSGNMIQDPKLSSSLLYNEYIVYNINQINIRYLLQINFNYANRR